MFSRDYTADFPGNLLGNIIPDQLGRWFSVTDNYAESLLAEGLQAIGTVVGRFVRSHSVTSNLAASWEVGLVSWRIQEQRL